MAAPATGQIVDDFENSFQACLAALTNPDHFNVHDSEEIKTGVEQTIQRFLDLAKQMECFFLQKRLLLSVQKPEHIILEDINELKNELSRKDQLLQKYYEKIQFWQNLLADVPGTPRPPQQPPLQGTPPQPPQTLIGQPARMTAPLSQQPMPQGQQQHHLLQSHCGSSIPSSSVSATMTGGIGQPPQGIVPSQQMHPTPHLAPTQSQGGLQGPLAYLERTMSNIGMSEPGR